jgi:hypothetical protein
VSRLAPVSRELSLEQAFRLLGEGPSRTEIGWVADRLREVGVRLDYRDGEAWHALVETAEAYGSGPFVALDLVVAVESGVESLYRGPRLRRRR